MYRMSNGGPKTFSRNGHRKHFQSGRSRFGSVRDTKDGVGNAFYPLFNILLGNPLRSPLRRVRHASISHGHTPACAASITGTNRNDASVKPPNS